MQTHLSSALKGPVTQDRAWWPRTKPRERRSASAVRTELVQRIRREIAAGTYETPEKWEAALDRLLDQLSKDEAE
jgi:hypothetical protein